METPGCKISDLCNEHYNKLSKRGKPGSNQWTVLSAVVLEVSGDLSVLTMATGTKCVGEEQRIPYIVSDSHAEVLCLRLFRLFLMEEMTACLRGDVAVCLKRGPDRNFLVKEGVAFHFYTSCVMCGDATISEAASELSDYHYPQYTDTSNPIAFDKKRPPTELPPSDSKLLKLDRATRTGAKCLISDNLHTDSLKARSWHKTSVLRTKPGRGPVCLSLSCSDKLMKRQFLGLQGGLLSQFLPDPLRFTSFCIGGEFSEESVKRALFDRLPDSSKSVRTLYKVKDTFVNSISNCRSRSNVHDVLPSSSSLLWLRSGKTGVQWASVKGKLQGATKSSSSAKVMLPVCRAAMLQRAVLISALLETGGNASVTTATLPVDEDQDTCMKQYHLFKRDSWYSVSKEEFCKNFVGWDRKISTGTHNASEKIKAEGSKL